MTTGRNPRNPRGDAFPPFGLDGDRFTSGGVLIEFWHLPAGSDRESDARLHSGLLLDTREWPHAASMAYHVSKLLADAFAVACNHAREGRLSAYQLTQPSIVSFYAGQYAMAQVEDMQVMAHLSANETRALAERGMAPSGLRVQITTREGDTPPVWLVAVEVEREEARECEFWFTLGAPERGRRASAAGASAGAGALAAEASGRAQLVGEQTSAQDEEPTETRAQELASLRAVVYDMDPAFFTWVSQAMEEED